MGIRNHPGLVDEHGKRNTANTDTMILNRSRGASKKPEKAGIRLDSSSNISGEIPNRLSLTLSASGKPWLPIAIGISAVILVIIALSLFFNGSSTPEVTDTAQESRQQNKQLEQLLNKAATQIKNNYLTSPKNNNAFDTYNKILKLEPGNKQALDGLKNIQWHYKSQFSQHISASQLIRAERDIRIMKKISTSSSTIKQMQKTLNSSQQKSSAANKTILENYSVTVSANKQLEIPGPPGELRVWIGISSNAPGVQPGMTAKTKELGAVGETARVTPFSLGIDVEPKVSICEKIDPSGSEVRFKLIPSKTGVFIVGANVELYDSGDCSGIPVPKSAKSVEVKVTVDEFNVIKQAIFELVETAWKAFLTFWDKFLLLIFALLLFLIRKKLLKWFRFKADK